MVWYGIAWYGTIPYDAIPYYPRGGTQHICIRGGQSKKFSGNPKISLQLHCNPKISAHFILRNLYLNIKYPETMQIEVRIACSEPRKYQLNDVWYKKNIINIVSVFFGPKNITSSNVLTQKYRTYLPVCVCAECPPLGILYNTIPYYTKPYHTIPYHTM